MSALNPDSPLVENASIVVSFSFELPRMGPELRPFESLISDTVRDVVGRTVGNLKALIEAEGVTQHPRRPWHGTAPAMAAYPRTARSRAARISREGQA